MPKTPVPTFDDQTLNLAKFMLRLSMSKHDQKVGARAAAYTLVVLSRLINRGPEKTFPEQLTDDEEDFLDEILGDASDVVEELTKGQDVSAFIQKLRTEAEKNRRHKHFPRKHNGSSGNNGQRPRRHHNNTRH